VGGEEGIGLAWLGWVMLDKGLGWLGETLGNGDNGEAMVRLTKQARRGWGGLYDRRFGCLIQSPLQALYIPAEFILGLNWERGLAKGELRGERQRNTGCSRG
jgi:hypothetical protein